MKNWILRTFFKDVYDRNYEASRVEENLKVCYWMLKKDLPDVADFSRFLMNSGNKDARTFQFHLSEFLKTRKIFD